MTITSHSSHNLRKTFGIYPTGIALTAGHLDGTPIGMLTNSFATVSLEPPLVTVSFAHTSTTWPQLHKIQRLGISFLSADDYDTAQLLRRPTAERFENLEVQKNSDGSLVLPAAAAHLIVELNQAFEAGDHIMTLWKVISHKRQDDARPLVFHDGTLHQLAA
ncbi:flavin reductase family protein [Rothia sp. ZJ1223]|uniref:flavin reductase family protein n=1 Tax=Rothia sp. ZJ1223 TaxID=2811098 RepID=UPI00195F057C|nr:flavin reductase family protein [Rothia sp. ZJ1223]MBM7050589.1 flavin reductase family protein [Rothia sp. ZJ1223]